MGFYIKRLKEKDSDDVIYPQTVGSAVFLNNDNNIEQEFSEVKSSIPTKVSELSNDSNYITTKDIKSKAEKEDVGDTSELYTRNKSTIVSAINEVYNDKFMLPPNGKKGQVLTKAFDGCSWSNVEYRKLNTIQIEESTYSVTQTVDSDGAVYGLKSITAIISNSNGINGGSNSYAFIYDSSDNIIGGMPLYFYASQAAIQAFIEFKIVNNLYVEMNSSGWTSASYSPYVKSYRAPILGTGNISKIVISSNGLSFNQGTKFEIYGVDA